MKSKNVILGAIAFVFAFGSAIASSMFLAVPTYVRSNNAQANPCNLIGNFCDGSGGATCSVQVFDSSDGALVTKTGYRQGCTQALAHSTSAVIIPPTQIVVP